MLEKHAIALAQIIAAAGQDAVLRALAMAGKEPRATAAVVAQAVALHAAKARLAFAIHELGKGRLEDVAQAMLGWALSACAGTAKNAVTVTNNQAASACPSSESPADVSLRIARKANQLVFVMSLPLDKGRRFSKSILKECVASFKGIVIETNDGGLRTVHALVNES